MQKPASQLATADWVAQIDAALPQTQCTRCGYPDCHAYAQALADGAADINQCPPGGAQGVQRLADITGRPVLALNADHGSEGPRTVAFIDEAWCIGCTLCIKACPTDAIVGSNKLMHTIIEAYCTGCELCVPVCPVDCIELEITSDAATGWAAWSEALALQSRQRYTQRQARTLLEGPQRTANADQDSTQATGIDEPVMPSSTGAVVAVAADGNAAKKSAIAAAMKAARLRRQQGQM